MKNVLVVLAVAMFILAGCSKESNETLNPKANQDGEAVVTVQLVDANTNEPVTGLVTVSRSEFEKYAEQASSYRSSSVASVSGNFTLGSGAYHHSFSAISNNGGVHGQGQIWSNDWSMHTETECVEVSGPEGTFSAFVNQASSTAPHNVGSVVWYRVFDGGEGSNAMPDGRSNFYVFAPGGPNGEILFSVCEEAGAAGLFAFWDFLFDEVFEQEWEYIDVDGSGNIQVD